MRPAKSILLAPVLLILVSANSLLAQPATATLTISPQPPTTDDAVVLNMSGVWPDACIPGSWAAPSLTRQGAEFTVLFPYNTQTGGCASVLTPWSLNVPLGKLAAGAYQAQALLSQALLAPRSLGTTSFSVTAPQAVHIWVPSFASAPGAVALASRLAAFNNGTANASVALVAAYDETGKHVLSTPPVTLAPGHSTTLATEAVSAGSIRFVELTSPTHVALRAALAQVLDGSSESRLALPVFTEMLPAGAVAAAGPIETGESVAFQRANLTLFNAGTSAATFTATIVRDGVEAGSRTYTVEAQTTRQFNDVLDASTASSQVWLRISADQPFLAYASGVFGLYFPYEVFPAKTDF